MQFAQIALTAGLALTSSVAAYPLAVRQTALQDFQVTALHSYSPSGRPGEYPWATITAEVTDPNEINLGTASDGSNVTSPAGSQGLNCIAKWYTRGGESPLGRTWPCDATSNGYWLMNVLEGSDGFNKGDFNLKFTHVADVLYRGQQFKAGFEAEGHFAVGENLSGSCGGSGICNWGLKADQKPFGIVVTEV